MNLIIDAGNTQVKWAIFEEDHLMLNNTSNYDAFEKGLNEYIKHYPGLKNVIISSVGNFPQESLLFLTENFEVHILSHKSRVPFKSHYKTPQTLGVDRMALVSAAALKFPNANCLVIDAGTCITYDFLDSDDNYHGGAISPGIRLRYMALHNLTANLPLLDTEEPMSIIGGSTAEAIHSGVIFGICNEIDGTIGQYKAQYQDLTVILTGGDANFLSKKLKSTIFANPNFLIEGLNFILKLNSS